jgi:hypothetical protein
LRHSIALLNGSSDKSGSEIDTPPLLRHFSTPQLRTTMSFLTGSATYAVSETPIRRMSFGIAGTHHELHSRDSLRPAVEQVAYHDLASCAIATFYRRFRAELLPRFVGTLARTP